MCFLKTEKEALLANSKLTYDHTIASVIGVGKRELDN